MAWDRILFVRRMTHFLPRSYRVHFCICAFLFCGGGLRTCVCVGDAFAQRLSTVHTPQNFPLQLLYAQLVILSLYRRRVYGTLYIFVVVIDGWF